MHFKPQGSSAVDELQKLTQIILFFSFCRLSILCGICIPADHSHCAILVPDEQEQICVCMCLNGGLSRSAIRLNILTKSPTWLFSELRWRCWWYITAPCLQMLSRRWDETTNKMKSKYQVGQPTKMLVESEDDLLPKTKSITELKKDFKLLGRWTSWMSHIVFPIFDYFCRLGSGGFSSVYLFEVK